MSTLDDAYRAAAEWVGGDEEWARGVVGAFFAHLANDLPNEMVEAAGDELFRYMIGEDAKAPPRHYNPEQRDAFTYAITDAAGQAMGSVLSAALARVVLARETAE